MKFSKREVSYFVLIFFLCVLVYQNFRAGASLVNTCWGALKPFLFGAGIAYVVNIVMFVYEKWYQKYIKWHFMLKFKRPIAMLFAYLSFILVIIWIFFTVIPDLISSIQSLLTIDTQSISHFITEFNDNKFVAKSLDLFGQNADIGSIISKYTQQILQQLLSFLTSLLTSVSGIVSTIMDLFISFVFSIYVLANKETLIRQCHTLVEVYTGKIAPKIFYVTGILHNRFHHFFVGQTIESTILGILTFVGMLIFSFPYATTVSVIVGFASLIPVVGAYIGASVGFILIATNSLSQAFFFLIFLAILQQLEGNILYPKVVGNSIGLPGIWVLLAITLGGAISGIFGMMIAVPIAGTIYQLIKDNVKKRQLNQDNN